jgi:hypothetical protein
LDIEFDPSNNRRGVVIDAEPLYHRNATPKQSLAVALEQRQSGEIWGAEAQAGCGSVVQAYQGPLRPGMDGIEFTVVLPPDPGCAPGWAEWRPPRVPIRRHNGIEYAILEQVLVTKIVNGGQIV